MHLFAYAGDEGSLQERAILERRIKRVLAACRQLLIPGSLAIGQPIRFRV